MGAWERGWEGSWVRMERGGRGRGVVSLFLDHGCDGKSRLDLYICARKCLEHRFR
jgi:hypothetical protein